MIIGYASLQDSSIQDDFEWSDFSKISGGSNCRTEAVTYGRFAANLLIDPRLPVNRNDYLFIDEERGILVLIDGFIYNQVNAPSTPQLLLKLFLSKGHEFVKDLNGDFAICIYQNSNQSISFFRDHVGIRPLAFSQTDTGVFFSTDPMGLCKALSRNEQADTHYIKNSFLSTGYNYSILPNKRVRHIPPAHYLQIIGSENILSQYWHPEKIRKDQSLSCDQVMSAMEALVTDAIKIRSDHRFKASAHVSGGIDSGVVAALARKEYSEQRNFYGFSWSPKYTLPKELIEFDERLLVEDICKLNDIIPQFIDFTEDDQLLQLKSWRYPSQFVFEHKVVEMAEKNAVNLIFSGWGGDEFISIGHRGIDADLIREFSWRSFLKKHPLSHPKKLAGSLLFNVLFPSAQRSYTRYKADTDTYAYLKKSMGSNRIPKKQRFNFGSRRKVHLQLLQLGHLADRTKDWYVLGQQNGIEYRYPLLDKRIIEFMLTVPSRCLTGGTNYRIILRGIGKDILPEAVLKNMSKDDPILRHFYKKFSSKANKRLLDELDDFRSNPNLAFVDFDLLEDDIKQFNKTGNNLLEEKIWSIVYYLKSAHEFTKGYNIC